jgi:hypothetical protein
MQRVRTGDTLNFVQVQVQLPDDYDPTTAKRIPDAAEGGFDFAYMKKNVLTVRIQYRKGTYGRNFKNGIPLSFQNLLGIEQKYTPPEVASETPSDKDDDAIPVEPCVVNVGNEFDYGEETSYIVDHFDEIGRITAKNVDNMMDSSTFIDLDMVARAILEKLE